MDRKLTFGLAVLLGVLICAGMTLANGSGPTVDWWVIAGGGAPSSGGNVTLNDTLGQPIVGSSSGGNVTLHAGYWPCNTPAAVSGVVATRPTATDVQLTWSGTGVFDVWRGTSPYFAPGDAGSVQIGNDVISPFTAAGVLGNPAVNYTFLVLAQNGCGASGPSNRTAEFDFSLTPGSP
ncbi:MAG: hypothetical protein NT169_26465 [Chloroflexi bacterium]|nr:hypothetical protein [Chloroflexota bacterium]